MSLNLPGLLASFATGTYTVTRRQSGGLLRGVQATTTNTTLQVQASVQPATGRDLLRLPELRRTKETRVVFSTTQLLTGDQGQGFEADWITINGDPWEIEHVEQWLQVDSTIMWRCLAQAPTPRTS